MISFRCYRHPLKLCPQALAKLAVTPSYHCRNLTLTLFHFWTNQRRWKAFYQIVYARSLQEFPKLPCYATLVCQINAHRGLALLLLLLLLGE
jgi:hypothetical protein